MFEEGGLPRVEFLDVYGIMTIRGIAKPAWRAFQLLHEHAGDTRFAASVRDVGTVTYGSPLQPASRRVCGFLK